MKLFAYEFIKLAKKRTLFLVAAGLLLSCVYVYLNEQKKNEYLYETKDLYEQIEKTYSALPHNEASQLLKQKAHEFTLRSILLPIKDSITERELFEYYNDDFSDIFDDVYKDINHYDVDETRALSTIYSELYRQSQEILSYPDFLAAIRNNKDNMIKFTIFAEKGTFAYNTIVKTADAFTHIKDIPLSFGLSEGITSITSFFPSDLCLILLLFLLGFYMFHVEYKEGLIKLIKTTQNGGSATLIAKFSVMLVYIFLFSFVFYGTLYLCGDRVYGYGNLGRYIQSMSEFRNCNIIFTVSQYFVMTFLLKYLVLVLINFIFCAVFVIFNSSSLTIYTVLVALFGISYLFYILIPSTYIFNHIKYINIFYFLDSYSFISTYLNLNFFNTPINTKTITLILTVALSLLCAIFTHFIYKKISTRNQRNYLKTIFDNFRKRFKCIEHSSLLLHEGYKILIQGKALFFILVLFIMALSVVKNYENPLFQVNDAVYRSYMSQLHGEISHDKIMFIIAEQQKFDSMNSKVDGLQQKYENHELSAKEKYEALQVLNSEIGFKYAGFKMVLEDIDYADNLKLQGINAYYVDQITADAFFNDASSDLLNGLICLIFSIVTLCNVICVDTSRNLVNLLSPTKRGRVQLLTAKYTWSILIIVVVYLAVYIPYYFNLYKGYGGLPWLAPLQSIKLYSEKNLNITIGQFMLLTHALRLIGLISMSFIIMAFECILKDKFLTLLFTTAVFAFPCFIQIQISDVRYVTFCNIFLLSNSIKDQKGILYSLVHIIIILFLGIVAVFFTPRLFRTKRINFRKRHREGTTWS